MHFSAAVVAALAVMLADIAAAEDYPAGPLQIGNPWARATPSGASVGAGYLTIVNKGTEPDRLIGGSAAPASRFEVHSTVVEQGVAKMRTVKTLEIGPGQTVELKPGGMHVMFVGLMQPLKQGQRVKGTLVFEKAGTVEIEFAVQAVGAPAGVPSGHEGH
jgi:hypothetical protein